MHALRPRAGAAVPRSLAAATSASSPSTTPRSARRSAARASGSTPRTDEAITDALRLARGMTYKSAVAGHQPRRRQVGHRGRQQAAGPGGAVPRARPLRRDAGRPLHHRGGHRHQPGGHGVHQAGDRPRGRPARPVGRSLAGHGLRRVRRHEGRGQGAAGAATASSGKTVAVQGCGNVATHLCRHLHEEGVQAHRHRHRPGEGEAGGERDRRRRRWRPTRSTTRRPTSTRPARSAPPSTTTRSPRLKVEIIAGGANNQLAEDRHGDLLRAARHPLRPGLRDQRRRRDQRLRRAPPLAARARRRRRRARSTRRCSGSSRSPSASGSPPTARRTAWPSSASRRWRGWIGCGWGSGTR